MEGDFTNYLSALARDCFACPSGCGRCESCLNCHCPDCSNRKSKNTSILTQAEATKLGTSTIESQLESSNPGEIVRMHFRYGRKSGCLKEYNRSKYTLYCMRVGDKDGEKWKRAPSIKLWEGKTYSFELIDKELPEGFGGIVLTERPEGGEGSVPLQGTSVILPGQPKIVTITHNTPRFFFYHDSMISHTGYVIWVDRKRRDAIK